MTKKDNHDAYIAAAPEQFRALLGQLRAQLSQALPDAEEVVKYDMPGFQIEETIIAGYAAFSKQCGLYVDPGAIADHADEIASLKLKATRTGVTFSASKPVPDELVEKLAVSSRRKKGSRTCCVACLTIGEAPERPHRLRPVARAAEYCLWQSLSLEAYLRCISSRRGKLSRPQQCR
jgi:uncharacterized protein YdhG (YjbR/CyaY superfamily)